VGYFLGTLDPLLDRAWFSIAELAAGLNTLGADEILNLKSPVVTVGEGNSKHIINREGK
jgi:hypothetical protein